MKRPNWTSIKKQYAAKFPRLMSALLVLILALLIVVGIDIGATFAAHSTSTPRNTSTTHNAPTPPPNTIHYDNIQQTPVPGSVQVKVTLSEYTIVSSVTNFQAGLTYHFIVSNRGHVVHEFLIMPDNPDGTALSPDLQYKDKLIEIEQIAPGTTMNVNFTFSPSTTSRYEIACQMRGHYQAGMRLPIHVTG